jgi:hypothetical protein
MAAWKAAAASATAWRVWRTAARSLLRIDRGTSSTSRGSVRRFRRLVWVMRRMRMLWLQTVARAAAGSSSPCSSSRLRRQACLAVRGSLPGVVLVLALVVLGVVGLGSPVAEDLGLL